MVGEGDGWVYKKTKGFTLVVNSYKSVKQFYIFKTWIVIECDRFIMLIAFNGLHSDGKCQVLKQRHSKLK